MGQDNELNSQPVNEETIQASGDPFANGNPEVKAPAEPPVAAEVLAAPATPDINQAPVAPVAPVATNPTLLSTPPKKKSKLGLIIVIIVAAVLLVAAGAAVSVYAFVYNNPQNAVADSFAKSFTAKDASVTGKLSYADKDGSGFVADMNYVTQGSTDASGDMTLALEVEDKDFSIKGHFATTKDKMFMKVDNLNEVMTNVYGQESADLMTEYYGDLMNKIDNKWVVVTYDDLSELSEGEASESEMTCVVERITTLQTDAAVRDEVMEVYKKHPLFTVESKGSDSNGNRYGLVPVGDAEAQAFANALVETKFFTGLDDCVADDMKKLFTEDFVDESTPAEEVKVVLDVWVDAWTHAMNKVTLSSEDKDGSKLTADFTMAWDKGAKATIPTADTTVDDIRTEIESITQEYESMYDEYYDSYGSAYGLDMNATGDANWYLSL